MNILKASFFKGGSHEIREVTCAKLTDSAVCFDRPSRDAQAMHSSYKILSRQTLGTRYCETESEAKQFIKSQYRNAIESLENQIKTHEEASLEMFVVKELEAA